MGYANVGRKFIRSLFQWCDLYTNLSENTFRAVFFAEGFKLIGCNQTARTLLNSESKHNFIQPPFLNIIRLSN